MKAPRGFRRVSDQASVMEEQESESADSGELCPDEGLEHSPQSATSESPDLIRGPHGWLNWYAERSGDPRREGSHPDSVVIRPIWEEFALYTDALLGGSWLTVGPYEFIHLRHVERATIGNARKLLLLRAWDHLEDSPPAGEWKDETDIEDYFGGDIGDEMAALLGLALNCRIRSGGSVREGLPLQNMPLGLPNEQGHQAPALQPPHRQALINTLADTRSLDDARELLETYPDIRGEDAVALVRSARQFVDGLWLADADPRLAWIKLIGALEAAAGRRKDTRDPDPIARLKRSNRQLYNVLKDGPEATLKAVAEQTSRLFHAELKVRSFVKAFDPGPPQLRPKGTGWRFDWASLDKAIRVIYNHRSRDLHDGIPFPWPLCEPPHLVPAEDMPSERFPALGVSGRGGKWTAEELPMYLHVFAHIVGGSLRNWWVSITAEREDG